MAAVKRATPTIRRWPEIKPPRPQGPGLSVVHRVVPGLLGERVVMRLKGGIQLLPVGLVQKTHGGRQHFQLFQAHVIQIESHILFSCIGKGRAPRFTEQLPSQ